MYVTVFVYHIQSSRCSSFGWNDQLCWNKNELLNLTKSPKLRCLQTWMIVCEPAHSIWIFFVHSRHLSTPSDCTQLHDRQGGAHVVGCLSSSGELLALLLLLLPHPEVVQRKNPARRCLMIDGYPMRAACACVCAASGRGAARVWVEVSHLWLIGMFIAHVLMCACVCFIPSGHWTRHHN